jgi:hypothetical protein
MMTKTDIRITSFILFLIAFWSQSILLWLLYFFRGGFYIGKV